MSNENNNGPCAHIQTFCPRIYGECKEYLRTTTDRCFGVESIKQLTCDDNQCVIIRGTPYTRMHDSHWLHFATFTKQQDKREYHDLHNFLMSRDGHFGTSSRCPSDEKPKTIYARLTDDNYPFHAFSNYRNETTEYYDPRYKDMSGKEMIHYQLQQVRRNH